MISIISSLYKSERHLPYFLEHAKKMHEDLAVANINFEHLLIANDISEEEQKQINESNCNFNLISIPRESLYTSWNRGIRDSKGSSITFWNVDDIRFSEAIIKGLETLNNHIEATYFPFIYKRYITILGIPILMKKRLIDPPEYDRVLFMKEMHAGPFFIVNKKAFDRIGLFDERFKIAGDFEWWARASKENIVAKKTNIVAGIFNNDGTTLSGSKNVLQKEENSIIYNKI